MIRWLIENISLMVLALIFAVVVWLAQEWDRDPILEHEFEEPVPVEVINKPSGLYLVEGAQEEVSVRLRAPRSVWNQLSVRDINAVLDLSPNLVPLEPGEWDVPVQVSLDVEPAVLLDVEPKFLRVELEAIHERPVPVVVQLRGDPDLGYQAGQPVYTDTVTVRGPASQVEKVAQATTTISLQGLRDSWDGLSPPLTPVDADGRRVQEVTLNPEQIQVSVPINPLPNVKEMSVTWTQVGQPADGYHVTNISIEPPVVRVRGPVFILNDLPGFLTTEPISIEGRTEDVVERVPLDLPPGIAMFDPKEPAVQVRIEIDPFFDSVSVTSTLTFQGLRPGLMAVASPEVVEVILSGPRPRLSTLQPGDVRVILDLSDLSLGDEEQLEPVVIPPEGITAESILPSVVQVQIVRAPAATATPPP
jgi:YbbR domain-containing protein